MNPESNTKTVSSRSTLDRWIIAIAALAMILATIGLLAGRRNIEPKITADQIGIATSEPENKSAQDDDSVSGNTADPHDPQAATISNVEFEVEELNHVEVPIIGLEEEIQQKMDAMFVKPDEALKSVETPKPDISPGP